MSIPGRRTFVDQVGAPGGRRRPRVPRWTPRPVLSGRLDRKSSWEGVGLGGGGTLPAKSPGGPEGIAGGGGHTTPLTQSGDGSRRTASDTGVTRYMRAAGLIDHQCTHLLLCSGAVSYTHLRAHETDSYLVCRLLLEKKKKQKKKSKKKKKKTQ